MHLLGVSGLRIIPAKGEEIVPENAPPHEIVMTLSRQKAREVAATVEGDCVIIAADTIVVIDGEVLGKPRDERDAAQMLKKLSGRTHMVFTGVTIIRGERVLCQFEKTNVNFRELEDDEIAAYVKTGEPLDKAGAYGVQGRGSLFVTGIEGDFFNVMGLPLCRLGIMLKDLGVNLI